jgi:adenine-specific DNA methylase
MFQKKILEKMKTQFCVHKAFFKKNGAIYDIMWKYVANPNCGVYTILLLTQA